MAWVRGASGNPGGRIRDKEFTEALRLAVNTVDPVSGYRKLRVIAEKLVAQACQGEAWAICQLADRLEGKPAQAIDMKHDATDAFGQLWAMISSGMGRDAGSLPHAVIEHQSDQDVTH